MKKMGLKKKLLVGITTGALVVSAAFTYASWDQLTSNTDAKVTLRQGATTAVTEMTLAKTNSDAYQSETTDFTKLAGTGKVKVDASNTLEAKAAKVNFAFTVNAANGGDVTNNYDIIIKDATTDITTTGADVAAEGTLDKTYDVTVTPKDDNCNDDGELTVTITATMSAVA